MGPQSLELFGGLGLVTVAATAWTHNFAIGVILGVATAMIMGASQERLDTLSGELGAGH